MLFMPVVEGADSSIDAAGDRRLDRRLVGVACLNIAVADIFHAQCLSLCKADLTAVPSFLLKCTAQNMCIHFFSHARQLPIEDVAGRTRSAAMHIPQYLPGYGNLKPN